MINKITFTGLINPNKLNQDCGKAINTVQRDSLTISKKAKENMMTNKLLLEMEEYINNLLPNTKFQYPEAYKKCGVSQMISGTQWEFPKGKFFIEESMDYLKQAHNITHLVPFAVDTEATKYACFISNNGVNTNKVVVIYPFAETKNVYQNEYKNIEDWLKNGIDN